MYFWSTAVYSIIVAESLAMRSDFSCLFGQDAAGGVAAFAAAANKRRTGSVLFIAMMRHILPRHRRHGFSHGRDEIIDLFIYYFKNAMP